MGADRDQAEVEAEQLFLRIGLTEQTAKYVAFALPAAAAACEPASLTHLAKTRRNSVKNPKFRQALVDVIQAAGAAMGAPKARGALLYQIASKVRTHGSARSTPTPSMRQYAYAATRPWPHACLPACWLHVCGVLLPSWLHKERFTATTASVLRTSTAWSYFRDALSTASSRPS